MLKSNVIIKPKECYRAYESSDSTTSGNVAVRNTRLADTGLTRWLCIIQKASTARSYRSSPFIADLISHPPYSNFRSSRGYRPSRDDSQIWNLTGPWEHDASSVFIKWAEMKKIDSLQKKDIIMLRQLDNWPALSEIKLTRKKRKRNKRDKKKDERKERSHWSSISRIKWNKYAAFLLHYRSQR